MFRLLVVCAILTFAESHYSRLFHTPPPFHGNPCFRNGRCFGQHHNMESSERFPYRHRHCRPPFCPSVTERPNPETQKTIEQELADWGEKFQRICKENSAITAVEMYGTDGYYLKYDLRAARDKKVKVQIKHKLIYTTVTKKAGNEKVFEDVKILPDIGDADSAHWTIQNNKFLKITIKYKVPLGTEVPKDCGTVNLNKEPIDVPTVLYAEFDYRFGQNSTEIV